MTSAGTLSSDHRLAREQAPRLDLQTGDIRVPFTRFAARGAFLVAYPLQSHGVADPLIQDSSPILSSDTIPLATPTSIVTTTTTTANRKPVPTTDSPKANGNESLSSPEQEEL